MPCCNFHFFSEQFSRSFLAKIPRQRHGTTNLAMTACLAMAPTKIAPPALSKWRYFEDGGGGGNRTRVRKEILERPYTLVWVFDVANRGPTQRGPLRPVPTFSHPSARAPCLGTSPYAAAIYPLRAEGTGAVAVLRLPVRIVRQQLSCAQVFDEALDTPGVLLTVHSPRRSQVAPQVDHGACLLYALNGE